MNILFNNDDEFFTEEELKKIEETFIIKIKNKINKVLKFITKNVIIK